MRVQNEPPIGSRDPAKAPPLPLAHVGELAQAIAALRTRIREPPGEGPARAEAAAERVLP